MFNWLSIQFLTRLYLLLIFIRTVDKFIVIKNSCENTNFYTPTAAGMFPNSRNFNNAERFKRGISKFCSFGMQKYEREIV